MEGNARPRFTPKQKAELWVIRNAAPSGRPIVRPSRDSGCSGVHKNPDYGPPHAGALPLALNS